MNVVTIDASGRIGLRAIRPGEYFVSSQTYERLMTMRKQWNYKIEGTGKSFFLSRERGVPSEDDYEWQCYEKEGWSSDAGDKYYKTLGGAKAAMKRRGIKKYTVELY